MYLQKEPSHAGGHHLCQGVPGWKNKICSLVSRDNANVCYDSYTGACHAQLQRWYWHCKLTSWKAGRAEPAPTLSEEYLGPKEGSLHEHLTIWVLPEPQMRCPLAASRVLELQCWSITTVCASWTSTIRSCPGNYRWASPHGEEYQDPHYYH